MNDDAEEIEDLTDEDGAPSSLGEWPEEPAERVRTLVEIFLDELELDGEVVIEEDEDSITASVEGDGDYGVLIGRRGQTIDALQVICFQAAFKGLRDRKRVTVDAAGYRAEREEMLESRADRAADDALSTGDEIEMDPMPARERRVVHERLRDRAGVETFSAGDEPNRYVVVAPRGWDRRLRGRHWAELAALPWVWTPRDSVHHRLLAPGADGAALHAALSARYAGERFVRVMPLSDPQTLQDGFFDVQACNDTNRVDLFVFAAADQSLLIARLDNLGKGASGAAIQAMNVHLGVDEGLGL